MSSTNPNLPEEIWGKIFTYLPVVEDRNNLRLTCRAFYEACNHYCFLVNENFSLNNINSSVIQALACADRRLFNLTLNRVMIDDSIIKFFEKQGASVHSVTFRKCEVAPGNLKQIIAYCENLQHISLLRVRNQDDVFKDFIALEKNQIISAKVTHFTLHLDKCESYTSLLTNRKFLRFFAVFPNIRKLEVKIPIDQHFNQFSTLSSELISDDIFTFSSIYNLISRLRNQLEDLRLFFKYDSSVPYLTLQTLDKISNIKIKNLKRLSLNWINLWDHSVQNPFLSYQNLTRVDCIMGDNIPISTSVFVKLLLSTATELHFLTIGAICCWGINKECFVELVRSKLQILKMYVLPHPDDDEMLVDYIFTNFSQSSLDDILLLPNYNLKHLNFGDDHNRSLKIFLTHFLALESITIQEISGDILQNVFKHQTKLKDLTVYNCDNFPYDGIPSKDSLYLQNWIRNENLSKRRLDNLTYLFITEDATLDFTEFLLEEFELRTLKSLVIKTRDSYSEMRYDIDPIWQAISKLTELEYLEIGSSINIPIQKWLELCSALPKFRYFIYLNNYFKGFHDLEYRQLFQVCQSLRIIVNQDKYCDSDSEYLKYYKDILTNTVENVRCNYLCIYEGIPIKYRKYLLY